VEKYGFTGQENDADTELMYFHSRLVLNRSELLNELKKEELHTSMKT
jgi:hypothetical protein